MARIVNTVMTPIITLAIQTIYKNGDIDEVEYKKEDIVTDMRYIQDNTLKTVTGRVTDITFLSRQLSRNYTDITKVKSSFASDVTAQELLIDCSSEYHSNIIPVQVREIVESLNAVDVERMKYYLKYGVDFSVELTDGTVNTFTIHEGQNVVGLTYLYRGKEVTCDAKVVAYQYDRNAMPVNLVIITDGKVRRIPALSVKSVEDVSSPVPSTESVADAIANTTNGKLFLGGGVFEESVVINKDIAISGANAGIPANTPVGRMGAREKETVLNGTFNVSGEVSVSLDGVTLTKEAFLSLADAKDVKIRNCVIKGLTPTAAKSYVLKTAVATKMKLEIKNCYFGENTVGTGNAYYNVLEMNCKLMDGSSISNNYFAKGCGSNNTVCIYDVDEGATVTVANNVWEYSGNGVRVGVKGDVECTINVIGNTYQSTMEDTPEYAGLLLIQPYGNQTTNMSRITVNINNTTHSDEHQLFYKYSGGSDMPFTEYNVPTVVVDGKVELAPLPVE